MAMDQAGFRNPAVLGCMPHWPPHPSSSSYFCTLAVCSASLKAVSPCSLFPVYTGSYSPSPWLWQAVMSRTVWIHPQVLLLQAGGNESSLCSLHPVEGQELLFLTFKPSLLAWLHLPVHRVGISDSGGKRNFSCNWHPKLTWWGRRRRLCAYGSKSCVCATWGVYERWG